MVFISRRDAHVIIRWACQVQRAEFALGVNCTCLGIKVALTFEFVKEILWSQQSNETSSVVLSLCTICFSVFCKLKFGIFLTVGFGHSWELKVK